MIPELDWRRFRAALFDVDGTLYDQRQLRKIMAFELGWWCLTRPTRWREAKILSTFRHLREINFERTETSLLEAQYRWTAEALGTAPAVVQNVVDEWMLRRPLRHLQKCRPPGLTELFERIRRQGVKIGIFSDYPAIEKLQALELKADAVACALDPAVNRLKPDPCGLRYVCAQLDVRPDECVHVGDRPDRDALCAERCGCASVILSAHAAKNAGRAATYDRMFPISRNNDRDQP